MPWSSASGLVGKSERVTGFPRKRNGNMRAGRERRRGIVLATRPLLLESMPGTTAILEREPMRQAESVQTALACMTCTVTRVNGVWIGTTNTTTRSRPSMTRKGPESGLWRAARGGSFSAPPFILRLLPASSPHLVGVAISVFGWHASALADVTELWPAMNHDRQVSGVSRSIARTR